MRNSHQEKIDSGASVYMQISQHGQQVNHDGEA